MTDPLDTIPIDACPDCGTALQDARCRGCGFAREVPPRGAADWAAGNPRSSRQVGYEHSLLTAT
jgi:hypothetical protein